jgi:catechol 2,3-dioxygenase-like lactoylglutathione lyase family enzyme
MDDRPAITALMLDTADIATAERFWTTLLGLDVVHRADSFVYLGRITEGGPYLALQQVPEPKTGKNRLHFDIRVPDRAAAAEQVVALGGRVLGEHQEGDFPAWTIVADPEGNEFCVYQPSNPG